MTEAKRRLLAARAMSDVAAAQMAIVVRLADSLQLFKKLQAREMTAEEVGEACGVAAARANAMLVALAASGYVDFDRERRKFSVSPEQASVFSDENDSLFSAGAFELAVGLARGDQDEIDEGIARSSRAKFPALIVRLIGERLERGATVIDHGCGSGGTLVEIARRYPAVRALGVDRSDAAIARARAAARLAAVDDRVTFITGDEKSIVASSGDVILSLEVLHEAADAASVARAAHAALREGGVWLIVEPCAHTDGPGIDTRFLASLAALYCLPAAGFAAGALGPLAPREAYERVVTAGGFTRMSVADEGPVHIVIQASR